MVTRRSACKSSSRRWKGLVVGVAALCVAPGSAAGEADQSHLLRGSHSNEQYLQAALNNEAEVLKEPINQWERKLYDARIVGGKDAPKGRYRVQVACYDSSGAFGCGASLIASNVVLCAAHCHRNCDRIRVDIDDRTQNAPMKRVVKKVKHPDYGKGFPGNRFDIMLMLLDSEVDNLTPMMLLDDESQLNAGDKVTVTGFGATQEGGSSSKKLKEVELKYIDNNRCQQDYGNRITKDMLCAHVNGGGKDACQGDSGGPLMITGTDYTTDVQIGVVSWGYGCARPEYAGVYCRITEALGWIQKTMEKDFQVPASKLRLFSTDGNGGGDIVVYDTGSTTQAPGDGGGDIVVYDTGVTSSTITPQGGSTTQAPNTFSPTTTGFASRATSTTTSAPETFTTTTTTAPTTTAAPTTKTTTTTTKPPVVPLTECEDIFKDNKLSWDPKCENIPRFSGNNGYERDCAWVALDKDYRCTPEHSRYCCPITCGACDDRV